MSVRRLLLDAGNTRLKWAVVEDGMWQKQGSAAYDALQEVEKDLTPETPCYVASVAGVQHEARIRALLASFAIKPIWLVSGTRFLDVVNSYEPPQQLGVDRWMGLIAARRRTQASVLVVSAGTAMTVDALAADGTFIGGLIVPGVALMQQALQHGTARVVDVNGTWRAFPRSTRDAVESGAVAALCGAVQLQHARLAALSGQVPHCILTGGNAEDLLPHLTMAVEHAPVLVLEGVACVAREDLDG